MTLDDAHELDVGSWFDPRFTGTRIPTLDPIIDAAEARGVQMLFDVKNTKVVEPLTATLVARQFVEHSIVSSTKLEVLAHASERAPGLRLLYYPSTLAEVEAMTDPPTGLRYIRIPKAEADDLDAVQRVVAAGFEAVTGEYRVDYGYAFGLVDDMDAVWPRVRDKVPADCP